MHRLEDPVVTFDVQFSHNLSKSGKFFFSTLIDESITDLFVQDPSPPFIIKLPYDHLH